MSSGTWTLEPNAERAILLPWLLDEAVDSGDKEKVLEYLADLLRNPNRPNLADDDTGVFSIEAVPRTRISLTWVLSVEARQVVLAYVG